MGCIISKRIRVKDMSTQTPRIVRHISNNMNYVYLNNKYIASSPINYNFGKVDYISYRKSIEYTNKYYNKYYNCNSNYNMCIVMPLRMMSEITTNSPSIPMSM